MDTDTTADSFSNIGIRGVLDLSRTRKEAGTPIILYPPYNPVAKNQAWYLERR